MALPIIVPQWDDSMSDGCSVPKLVRLVLGLSETPAETAVCVLHDKAYYYGGSSDDRAKADLALREGLVAAGMSRWLAWFYYAGVRIGGHPVWGVHNISWAFGGLRFSYTEKPAMHK